MTLCLNSPSYEITIPTLNKVLEICTDCFSSFTKKADRAGLEYSVEVLQN